MFYRRISTGMERFMVLDKIRDPAIIFPDDWDAQAKPNQTALIRALLQHDPTRRPSASVSGYSNCIKLAEYVYQRITNIMPVQKSYVYLLRLDKVESTYLARSIEIATSTLIVVAPNKVGYTTLKIAHGTPT